MNKASSQTIYDRLATRVMRLYRARAFGLVGVCHSMLNLHQSTREGNLAPSKCLSVESPISTPDCADLT